MPHPPTRTEVQRIKRMIGSMSQKYSMKESPMNGARNVPLPTLDTAKRINSLFGYSIPVSEILGK
jgi:hypothetical protein